MLAQILRKAFHPITEAGGFNPTTILTYVGCALAVYVVVFYPPATVASIITAIAGALHP